MGFSLFGFKLAIYASRVLDLVVCQSLEAKTEARMEKDKHLFSHYYFHTLIYLNSKSITNF